MAIHFATERFCVLFSEINWDEGLEGGFHCVDAVANGISHTVNVGVNAAEYLDYDRVLIEPSLYVPARDVFLDYVDVRASVFPPGANGPTIFQSPHMYPAALSTMVHPCGHIVLELEWSMGDRYLHKYFARVNNMVARGDVLPWPRCNTCNPPLAPPPQPVEPEILEVPAQPEPRESDLDAFTKDPFENDHLTDFHIKVEEELFWVHRVVLSRKSSVFRRMLVPGTKEAEDKYVEVKESTPDEMRCFLTALYDYEALANYETNAWALLGMYPLAEEYNTAKVRRFCENALRTVPIENDDFCLFVQRAHCFTALEFLMDRCVESASQLPPGYFKQGDGKQLLRSDAGESLVEKLVHRPLPAATGGQT